MNITQVFALNLKRLRKKNSWTQEGLAKNSRIALSTIQGYEGQRRWPERPYITAIAKAFDCPETELFRPIQAVEIPEDRKSLLKVLLSLEEKLDANQKEIEELKAKLEGYNIISPKLLEWFQKNKDFATLLAEVADEHHPGLIASRLIKLSRGGTTGEDER